MFIEAVEAAKLGAHLYENRHKIVEITLRLWNLFTEGKKQILVFGPGGVGKSTMGRVLFQDFNPEIHADYTSSVTQESYSLPGGVACDLLVPRGQIDEIEFNWKDLYDRLREGGTVGIINVVAYGFHSIQSLSYTETPVYEDGMTEAEFVDGDTEKRRDRELRVIGELESRIDDAPGELQMITLGAKQDLWWERRHEVRAWYENGPYGEVIRRITTKRGKRHFNHTYLSASFILRNFVDGRGEVLHRHDAEYDEMHKLAHQTELKRQIFGWAE